MNSATNIASIIALVVGALGVGAWIQGYYDRRKMAEESEKQRVHDAREAQRSRHFNRLADAYQEISISLSYRESYVALTEHPRGPVTPPPPDIDGDDEWIRLGGIVAVTVTDPTREVLRASADRIGAFMEAVRTYRQSEGDPAVRESLEKAREEALVSIQAAQTAMRDELDAI